MVRRHGCRRTDKKDAHEQRTDSDYSQDKARSEDEQDRQDQFLLTSLTKSLTKATLAEKLNSPLSPA